MKPPHTAGMNRSVELAAGIAVFTFLGMACSPDQSDRIPTSTVSVTPSTDKTKPTIIRELEEKGSLMYAFRDSHYLSFMSWDGGVFTLEERFPEILMVSRARNSACVRLDSGRNKLYKWLAANFQKGKMVSSTLVNAVTNGAEHCGDYIPRRLTVGK